MARREPRDWPGYLPVALLPVTGFRDQAARITYLPWSDALLGIVGWEVIPDRSTRALSVLVYVVPTTEGGTLAIRCHVANDDPNPAADPLLGKVTIPPEFLGLDE